MTVHEDRCRKQLEARSTEQIQAAYDAGIRDGVELVFAHIQQMSEIWAERLIGRAKSDPVREKADTETDGAA